MGRENINGPIVSLGPIKISPRELSQPFHSQTHSEILGGECVIMETDKRWSLAGKTALVTGGTRGIGFISLPFSIRDKTLCLLFILATVNFFIFRPLSSATNSRFLLG